MDSPLAGSILVATDMSENSDPNVRTAARLAEHLGAALHVLNALDLTTSRDAEDAGDITFQSRVQSCERALAEQLRRMVPQGVQVASQEVMIFAP